MKKQSKGSAALVLLGLFVILLIADIILHIVYLSKLSGIERTAAEAASVSVTIDEPSSPDGGSADTAAQDPPADAPDGQSSEADQSPYSNLGKKVFMGNSIITAVTEYGYMENEKFISKIGINVDTISSKPNFMTQDGQVDGITALKAENADSVFIMLGGNEVEWMPLDTMISKYKSLLASIRDINADMKIFIYSITPVEPNYISAHPRVSNEKILEWNEALKAMALEENVGYIDLDPIYTAEDGTLIDDYAEQDGMHWNSKGCRAFEDFMRSEGII